MQPLMEHIRPPERISQEYFATLVEEALDEIPDTLWERIDNLAIALKSPNFIRVRVGIVGKSVAKKKREQYVNQEFDPLENVQLINIINDAEAAIRSITQGDIAEVVEKFRH